MLLVGACLGGTTVRSTNGAGVLEPRSARAEQSKIRVVFRAGKVYAREGDREWPIAEVGRDEMLWAPDGLRFAYIARKDGLPARAEQAQSSKPTRKSKSKSKRRKKRRGRRSARVRVAPPTHHIVVRNIRGDSVNEFPAYRPGRPSGLDWIDDNHIGYVAPPDPSGGVYVVHSAQTGEILRVHRGAGFIWSPGRQRLAYIADPKRDHLVKVDQEVVWPRDSADPSRLCPGKTRRSSRRRRGGRRKTIRRRVSGDLVWSPDGSGLAFISREGTNARLVVLLVLDNAQGDLCWHLPGGALDPRNRLFWGDSRVVIGESMLKPRFAATWRRLR